MSTLRTAIEPHFGPAWTHAVDEAISGIFTVLEGSLHPKRRYLAFLFLLDGFGVVTPGYDRARVWQQLADTLSANDVEKLRGDLTTLRGLLRPWVAADYAVASYWSPIDDRRRTVFHRPEFKDGGAKYRTAAAYAFYAVTFRGLHVDLYSLIQFIAERASRKRGVITAFGDDVGGTEVYDDEYCWTIAPAVADAIRQELGFDDLVSALVRNEIDLPALDRALGAALRNEPDTPWPDIGEGAKTFVDGFARAVAGAGHSTREAGAAAAVRLQKLLSEPITVEQALFMIGTQAIWREACPTNLMYAFPINVASTCCILTIGSASPLAAGREAGLAYLAKAIFFDPLLRDYGWRQADQEAWALATRRMHLYRRLLGHNLPKFLIRPATSELRRIEQHLASEAGSANTDEVVGSALRRMRFLFRHYDSVLGSIMKSTTLERSFAEPVEDVRLADTVAANAEVALDIMRFRVGEYLQDRLAVLVAVDADIIVRAHRLYVTEMLFNLVSNAVEAIDPQAVRRDESRAQITVTAQVVDGGLAMLRVADRGIGMSEQSLRRFADAAHKLGAAAPNEFWELANALIESSMWADAREEHMGVGLLFCVTYLTSLQWQPGVTASGKVTVDSGAGEGTAVSLWLPIARSTRRQL
jgi:hypothetical protein